MITGPGRPAQTHENALCPQIHQQGKMRQDESRGEHRAGTEAARGGALHPQVKVRVLMADRPPICCQLTVCVSGRRELLLCAGLDVGRRLAM